MIMGPNKNPDLFQSYGEPRVMALDEEFERRMLLSSKLAELSELFEEKDNTSHPITESTLFARLYALSRLQHTPMSIAGFSGMEAVDMSRGYSDISAKAALYHDEHKVESEDGSAKLYRTRAIKVTIPETAYGDRNGHVEIFGLNFYQPEPDIEIDKSVRQDPASKQYLTLIGKNGRAQRKPQAITGETVVIAVRNKETNDAKLYAAQLIAPEDHEETSVFESSSEIVHKSIYQAKVTLPDQTQVHIETLSGTNLLQAVAEFSLAIDVLKAVENMDQNLNEEERAAVSATIHQS
jgi:hypothetical protein